MDTKKAVIIILIISLALNAVLAVFLGVSLNGFKNLKKQISSRQASQKVLEFAKLFVDKFLLSSGVVGFDDRLALENAVRDLNDEQIYKQWQDFINSPDNRQTQLSAGKLFNLLLKRLEPSPKIE